jgi:hypothetical protein
MKDLGIAMGFKSQDNNNRWITLPMIASTICKSASTLCVIKLNISLAKELISAQDASKRATLKLDTKDKKHIIKDDCKHLSANCQRSYCSFSLNISHFLMAP